MAGRFSEEGLAKIRRGRLKRYIDAVNKKHGSKIKIIEKSFTEQRNEVEFICSIHGHSSLKAETLLSSKYGCKKCALLERGLTRKKQQEKKIKNILSSFYKKKYILVDEWKGSKSRNKIFCKKHKSFSEIYGDRIIQRNLLCDLCIKEDRFKPHQTNDGFIDKISEEIKNKIDLSKVDFQGYKNDIIIICKKHGEKSVKPGYLLSSIHGCPDCGNFHSGYTALRKKNIEDGNIEHKKAKIGIIVVEVFGITGFKLGITTRKLEQRYKFDIRNIIFEYELNEIDAINLEMYLHEKFLDYRDNAIFYEGMNNGKRWNGDTEIYTKEGIKLILEELKKSINELNQLGNEFWEDKEFHIPHGLEAPLIKQEKGIFTTSKKVICLNSSKIYESITEAAKDIGTSQGNISMVCKGLRKHAKGMKFSYYDEDKTKNEIIEKQNAFRKTKVKCVEKNEIFSSITEASLKTGIPYSSIIKACSKERSKAGGFQWEYV